MRPLGIGGMAMMVLCAGCMTVQLPHVSIQPELGAGHPLKWHDMVQSALRNHPDILYARDAVQSSSMSRNIAAGDYLPKVDSSLNRSRSKTANKDAEYSYDYGVTATQNLFSGFETTGNTLKAQKNLDAVRLDYQETSADVCYRLRAAYVELLKRRQLLTVGEKIAERRSENAELIKLSYQAGRENLGSSLRADAIREQAFLDVRGTRRGIQSQSLRLGREMGGDFSLSVQVEGELEKLIPALKETTPDFPALAFETPQVRSLVKSAEAAKAAVVSAQAALWPKADLSMSDSNTGERSTLVKNETFLGLTVSLPFFNGGKNVEAIVKAKADYQAALHAARSARDETITKLSDAWVKLYDAVEQVEVSRQFLEASRKRADIIRTKYTSGLATFQEFDLAEQDAASAEKSLVADLADAVTQQAQWDYLKGVTLEDALNEA